VDGTDSCNKWNRCRPGRREGLQKKKNKRPPKKKKEKKEKEIEENKIKIKKK
jgi:hypothetical protein